ncbi:MinD/ParA family protein [Nocardia sp. NPDC058058]|uniref:MinD/ParA family ATP-binding protein n=1 Tax=Nocardia sp. NPDC058058 TaxID=3346317 RepID=UPI0036DAD3A1
MSLSFPDHPAALSNTPTDLSVLLRPAPPGAPTDVVRLRSSNGFLLWADLPPVLVLGSSGGAGTTTTALGVATAASYNYREHSPIVVDATATGGDLARRGCDAIDAAGTVQSWLNMSHRGLASAVLDSCGENTSSVGILPRGPEALPRRESYSSVHRSLCDAGCLPVYDGGSPVTNRMVAPLLADSRIALVITLAARSDAVNRLRPALIWLDDNYSEYHLAEAVIVVTRQNPGDGPGYAKHIRQYLGKYVRAVTEIPYDAHLATGGAVSWSKLAPPTRTAYRQIVNLLR